VVAALIDGDWKMVLSTPMGPQEMQGHFESEGQSLSGYLSSPEGRQGFTGTVEGHRVKFDLMVVKPMKITLKYDLAVEGDKLTGKVKMGIFGSAKLTGERVREAVEA
jgi:aerobic carbon-monoxide dehydrogenase large subunit